MAKVFKGVGKAIKGVVNGVKKVFKKVIESKIGKALLIGATIYLGGAALGMWNAAGPFAGINGALVGGKSTAAATAAQSSSAAAQVASAGTTAQLAPGAGVLAPGAGGGATMAAAPSAGQALISSAVPQVAGGTAANTAFGATTAAATGGTAAGVMAPGGLGAASEGAAAKGILNRLLAGSAEKLTKAAGFAEAHPYATAMALNATSAMFSPDQVDVMQMQQDREDEERLRKEKNLDVSSIRLGISPSNSQYTYTDGTPVFRGGILNTSIPRRT